MTYREAAVRMLKERGPMHYKDLMAAIEADGSVQTQGATPAATLNAILAVDVKRKGTDSVFIRVRPGVFGLQGIHEAAAHVTPAFTAPTAMNPQGDNAGHESDLRVRIPLFPVYSELRHLLRVWPGYPRKHVTGLRATIEQLRGTPQKTVDWTDPSSWITERLDGDDQRLAQAVWDGSRGAVNPRHTYGHWLLAQRYDLLRDDGDGVLQLTGAGLDFLEQPGGEAESAIDEAEGILKLLSIVADNGPARAGGLVEEWGNYLSRRSPFRTELTVKDAMRRRLSNLLERGLVERNGHLYSATAEGLACLERIGDEDGGGDHTQVQVLIRQRENEVRRSLHELLQDMDPIAFEHVIKRLLEEMDCQNVDVTARSGDGGVDVVGDIELGITSVREVVQVKRHRKPIQRKDLDALRGSLYRFNAVRGTIVTTSRFAQGTQKAAFATGAAPITLIDGEKLIDLLIEHGIGVRKRTVELLGVDAEAFAASRKDG